MSLDQQLIDDFKSESTGLIGFMVEILETCEGNFSQVKRLEEYGQTVDRIMGGAQSLAMMEENRAHLIHAVGDYAAVCKAVGYKASQIQGNQQFYDICVALLLDATEILQEMVEKLDVNSVESAKNMISKAVIERLRWVSNQFSAEYRASVSVDKNSDKMSQNQIDDLLKKMGL